MMVMVVVVMVMMRMMTITMYINVTLTMMIMASDRMSQLNQDGLYHNGARMSLVKLDTHRLPLKSLLLTETPNPPLIQTEHAT